MPGSGMLTLILHIGETLGHSLLQALHFCIQSLLLYRPAFCSPAHDGITKALPPTMQSSQSAIYAGGMRRATPAWSMQSLQTCGELLILLPVQTPAHPPHGLQQWPFCACQCFE